VLPLGVFFTLALALVLDAVAGDSSWWRHAGGFLLLACVLVALAVGERDEKFRSLAERMAERLPRAEVVVVEGAGHAAQLEQPDAVAALL